MEKVVDTFRGDYWFLSNFCPIGIKWNGYYYRTLEHAYQAAKTEDIKDKWDIRNARSPGEAKRLGRQVILIDNWEELKDSIMYALLRVKFDLPHFKDGLLATDNMELIEGNNWGDRYWGVCNNTGRNMLGKLLMQVRRDIKEAENASD